MASDLVSMSTGRVVSTCPKLAQGGTNWISYKEKMTEHLTGQVDFRKHLQGRARPPDKPTEPAKDADKAVKDRYEKDLDAYEDKLDEYLQKQAAIASTLTSSWPDDVHQLLHQTFDK
ncbi:hypothetical protein DFH09DRAFT_922330 [Mycena vulgaris]|nr:hypothetical protein DFH09DRAFT_922330 [Mycena vulgaris]